MYLSSSISKAIHAFSRHIYPGTHQTASQHGAGYTCRLVGVYNSVAHGYNIVAAENGSVRRIYIRGPNWKRWNGTYKTRWVDRLPGSRRVAVIALEKVARLFTPKLIKVF